MDISRPGSCLLALLLAGTGFALTGCKELPSGTGTTTTATQFADDGDDKDGSPVTHTYPLFTYALDGPTAAHSLPVSYRQFITETNARVGPNPTRLAVATGSGKASSTFTVTAASESLELSTHSRFTPNINGGKAQVFLWLKFTDANTGSARFVSHYTYALAPKSSAPATIDIMLDGAPLASVQNNGTYEDVRTDTATLPKGSYRIDYEWTVTSTADGTADLQTVSYVEAK